MPKRVPEQELDAIVAIVAAHPDGVQVGPIRGRLPYSSDSRLATVATFWMITGPT
jgi:hypothetical protein